MEDIKLQVGVFITLSVLITVSRCSDRLSADKLTQDQKVALFEEHQARLRGYMCGDPQPRVIELKELNLFGKIFPKSTILHRCESSGCCETPKKRCIAEESEEVPLLFKQYIVKGGRPQVEYILIEATNHTKCSCQGNSPK